jgi:hypothetical protein
MPPQQRQRLLDFGDDSFGFGTHIRGQISDVQAAAVNGHRLIANNCRPMPGESVQPPGAGTHDIAGIRRTGGRHTVRAIGADHRI